MVKFNEPQENLNSANPILQEVIVNGHFFKDSTLKYHHNNLEFRYLTVNFRMNGKIPYRYRLHQKDNWQYTHNLSVNYPALPRGNYRFEVQSQNEDGYWSNSTAYAFSISPPWWATWWFRGVGLLALSFLSFSVYKYRTNQLKKENALLQQMNQLERSALQAQMNPHFIFNCLNSIQSYILQNNKEKAVEYLSRFAKLVRYNLDASVQGIVSLENEINILDNYLALERERFNHQFDYDIEVEDSLKGQSIKFPPLLIQPYVENAIIHGLAKKKETGRVSVHFSQDDRGLMVKILDNGTGYKNDKKSVKSHGHQSVGMTITQKRLELLSVDPTNVVKIQTLQNGNNELKGTQVVILIKT